MKLFCVDIPPKRIGAFKLYVRPKNAFVPFVVKEKNQRVSSLNTSSSDFSSVRSVITSKPFDCAN